MSSEFHLKLVEHANGEGADDLALARAAALGDSKALGSLLARVFDRVRRTTSYLGQNSGDAEDLLQLALIEIARSVGGFRGECPFEHWVDRIAVRTASEQLSKRRRRERLFELVKEEPILRGAPLDDATDKSRVRKRLAELLSRLSLKNRTAVVLHYLWGYGVAEIAEIVGCKENTVRGRVREGRKHLKREVLGDPLLSSWMDRRKP
jgi:RNA polymerase sigma-70 factor, ECF subfamily